MSNQNITDKLYAALTATHIEIIDNSWMHAGHAGMTNPNQTEGTHLKIIVVSPQFEGVSLLDRHRMVHQLLKEEFQESLHALELKTFTPNEWKD